MSSFFQPKNLVIALPAIAIIAIGSTWAANHNEFLAEQTLNTPADQNPGYEISCPDRSSLDVFKCTTLGKGLKITPKKQ